MAGGVSGPVVLALDATGLACSVAVAVGDRVASSERLESIRGQAERLLPMVDRVLSQAGFPPAALDLVAVTVGPGSFTGIRVGLAAARGIALATSARLIGVTSFDAVAVTAKHFDNFLLVALESRRDDLYVQLFDAWRGPVARPVAVSPEGLGDAINATIDARPLLIAGDAAQRAGVSLSGRAGITILKDSAPDAIGVLRAALRRLRLEEGSCTAQPLYLHPPGLTLPAKPRKPGPEHA